jgi:HEAT repeat protein
VAAPRSFDDKRARIAALAAERPATAAAELRRFLADKNGYLVGEAAKVAAELALRELVPDLCAAFSRLLDDAVKVDRGCTGKNRVIEALLSFDAHEPDVYLAGLRHVQREPAFPEPVDAAAGLRGLCAHALFHIGYPRAMTEVVPLLADPEEVTRMEAANALGGAGLDAAAAVLHLKVLLGDKEPDVLGACYRGLLRHDPGRYLQVVKLALLEGTPGVAEAAALALGESRAPGAIAVLKEALPGARGERLIDGILLGVALSRSDEGSAFLISLVESAPEGRAAAALSALALHRHDSAIVERVRRILDARGSRKLAAVFNDRFGP